MCARVGALPQYLPRSWRGRALVWLGAGLVVAVTLGVGCMREVVNLVPGVYKPERAEFTAESVDALSLPAGFSVTVFAQGLGRPRMLAAAEDGSLYATRPGAGDVLRLEDHDGDGVAEVRTVALRGLEGVHGIALAGHEAWLATGTELYRGRLGESGAITTLQRWLSEMPDPGRHPNRTLGMAPDGTLFLSVGSSCNACREEAPELAALLEVSRSERAYSIYARGLRNTIGFDWHPATDQLWGMDHGSDWRGADTPPDELNLISKGAHYGWPYVYGDRNPDPDVEPPRGTTNEAFAATTTPPVLPIQAHSAPIGFVFYEGRLFPEEYLGDAFVALHGSWNRESPVGYYVARVRFDAGRPLRLERFLDGFLAENGKSYFGRPTGLAVGADGALFVGDDSNGVIYRVAYGGR